MKPFFSIIIPVYNVAPYLRECLDSVLAQTFTDWEAICVDDGSEDGSSAILDEYVTKDLRFHVIHKRNQGVGAARNTALDCMNGKWVLFLDGDDVWNESLLSAVEGMIATYPSEKLLRFSFERFDGEFWLGRIKGWSAKDAMIVDISQTISMRDFGFFFFCCYVYRVDLFDGIRFPRYIRGEDRCVLNRIQLERVGSFVTTNAVLYGYRIREGSAMSVIPSVQVLRDEMDHRLDLMEMIDKSGKSVVYAGNAWLEKYFTTHFYYIVNSRNADRMVLVSDWRERLYRLRRMRGISYYGRFVAWSCSLIRLWVWYETVCYVAPRLGKVLLYNMLRLKR